MASLVLKMSISLDGYVAPPDGSGGWKLAGRSDDARDWVVETVSNAGSHLVGAATYTEWAAYWPGASGPFAEPMNEIPSPLAVRRGAYEVCARVAHGFDNPVAGVIGASRKLPTAAPVGWRDVAVEGNGHLQHQ